MAVRLGALIPRILVVVVVWILASGTLTFAAERHLYAHVQAVAPKPEPKSILVVPDVRSQAFVFAKGTLEDSGLAWKVVGGVHGYAVNKVAKQTPAAGTKLKFLRRIPRDPFTHSTDWGVRSTQDDPTSMSWGGQNVFDVYSKTYEKAPDGTNYSDW